MTYDDRRLAAIYDEDNPAGVDHDFFRMMADRVDVVRIVDLGCGTGSLTVTLAKSGRQVIGIDPAQAMVDYAAARPGGQRVEWRLGTSSCLDPGWADLIVMSSNVVMHLVGDAWITTLADVARGLRPGGRLVFDSRNPAGEAWRTWSHASLERDTDVGRLRESTEVTPPDENGVVTMNCRNDFLDDGGPLDVVQLLQFRTLSRLVGDLDRAGLKVEHVWGDWHRSPFSAVSSQKLIVVEASR